MSTCSTIGYGKGTKFASLLLKLVILISVHMYTHISIGRRKPVGLNARVLYENDSLHSQEYMAENSASIVILNNMWFGLVCKLPNRLFIEFY